MSDYRTQGRGGKGLISIQTSDRNGAVVSALRVRPSDEIILITDGGTLVRTRVDEVSVLGRNTQGVRLIRLNGGELLVGLTGVVESENDLDEDEENEAGIDANAQIGESASDAKDSDAAQPGNEASGDGANAEPTE